MSFLTLRRPPNANYTKHRMILGTHTSRTAQDHLMIAEVLLPKATAVGEKDGKASDDVTKDYDESKGGEMAAKSDPSSR